MHTLSAEGFFNTLVLLKQLSCDVIGIKWLHIVSVQCHSFEMHVHMHVAMYTGTHTCTDLPHGHTVTCMCAHLWDQSIQRHTVTLAFCTFLALPPSIPPSCLRFLTATRLVTEMDPLHFLEFFLYQWNHTTCHFSVRLLLYSLFSVCFSFFPE